MIVYRLAVRKFAKDLSGSGARLYGGRWNSIGVPLLYTSGSRALCIAEMAVHGALSRFQNDFSMLSLKLPLKFSQREIKEKDLPSDWRAFPCPFSTQKIGDQFVLDRAELVLKVPSVLVPEEFNYLLNPLHHDYSKIKINLVKVFAFDERLLQ